MKFIHNAIYFVLILRYVNLFVICDDSPSPREAQTASLVNNKLYFFGGRDINNNPTNEVWYLDLSSPFNVSMLPWHKDQGLPLAINYASSCVSPIDNSVFIIDVSRPFITNTSDAFYPSEIYEFDPNASYWKVPTITDYNSSFNTRYSVEAVIDNDGKFFIFGGSNSNGSNTTLIRYNEMHMLDTTTGTMKWTTLNISQNVPLPRIIYAAVLLPTDEIIYIGGVDMSLSDNLRLVDIKAVQLFNTKSFTWSTKQTTGAGIDSRFGFTAVLTRNGSIIIYGGEAMNYTSYKQVSPDLAVLNINTWEWSIPNISQKNAPPSSLVFHSATLYENYMIVSFGLILSISRLSELFYILDIRNYTWVTATTINNLGPLEPTPISTVLEFRVHLHLH
ncbi:galactose oxidase [Gigaspora margarita]|uniref:Galactose oxidase n=1 Tax=Gigaspora margarita TaxID=4874 RepID=A0A8H4EP63_GIGMA|nr:galactose oxidase [Gigaspora margarita]